MFALGNFLQRNNQLCLEDENEACQSDCDNARASPCADSLRDNLFAITRWPTHATNRPLIFTYIYCGHYIMIYIYI